MPPNSSCIDLGISFWKFEISAQYFQEYTRFVASISLVMSRELFYFFANTPSVYLAMAWEVNRKTVCDLYTEIKAIPASFIEAEFTQLIYQGYNNVRSVSQAKELAISFCDRLFQKRWDDVFGVFVGKAWSNLFYNDSGFDVSYLIADTKTTTFWLLNFSLID